GHDVATKPWRRYLAEFRKPAFVLRPQAVHNEGKRPRSALRVSRRTGRITFGAVGAERRRPRQYEHVIIELSGFALPAILSNRRPGHAEQRAADRAAKGKTHEREPHDCSPSGFKKTCSDLTACKARRGVANATKGLYRIRSEPGRADWNVTLSATPSKNVTLRPCCSTPRIIGPSAVKAYDTPFDAIAGSEHAAVLNDRIVDLMPLAVGNQRGSRAVAPGNGT